MTAEILLTIIKLNLAAAAAVVLVLTMRRHVRRWGGAELGYALWLAVPLSAVAVLLPARQIVVAGPALETGPLAPVAAEPSGALLFLWLAGVAVSLLALGVRQRRFLRQLGLLTPEPGFMRAAGNVAGPALVGAIFPRIVVPANFETRFGPEEREIILAHEAVHLARGDAAANLLLAIIQCVGWFNPFLHVAARAFRVDQELACDARVLASRPYDRVTYARALLKTQLRGSLPLGCHWPASGIHPLKERIAMIGRPSPAGIKRKFCSAFVALVCGVAGVGAWASQPPRLIADGTRPPAKDLNSGVIPAASTVTRDFARSQSISSRATAGSKAAAPDALSPNARKVRLKSPGSARAYRRTDEQEQVAARPAGGKTFRAGRLQISAAAATLPASRSGSAGASRSLTIAHSKLAIAHSKLTTADSRLTIAHSKLGIAHSTLGLLHDAVPLSATRTFLGTARLQSIPALSRAIRSAPSTTETVGRVVTARRFPALQPQ